MQKLIKAKESVDIAKGHFEANGFLVSNPNHPNANGVDLTVMKDGAAFTVEVKTATETTRSWRVSKCHTISDYIAIVMPSGHTHIEVMSDHLKLCSSDGSRRITRLVNIYDHMSKKLLRLLHKAPVS